MKAQPEAVSEIQEFLPRHGIQYLVKDGIANAIWGRPRTTTDADFKVLTGEMSIAEFVALIGSDFRFRTTEFLDADPTLVNLPWSLRSRFST